MIELYFLIYRIPKIMSSLARERNRSPLAWSLIGIASWLGSELVVALGLGSMYGVGMARRDTGGLQTFRLRGCSRGRDRRSDDRSPNLVGQAPRRFLPAASASATLLAR
jgi:hypothetical protein